MLRCPGCGLDNPEYARRCARCGGLLRIPGNVIPPRARRFFHPERLFYARRRQRGFHWDQPEAHPVSAGRRPADDASSAASGNILLALVPALFQIRYGRKIRGIIFLAIFLLGLLGVWALPGTQYFYWAIWLVILSQVWSLADALPWQGGFLLRLGKANLFGVMLFIALALVYIRLADRIFSAQGLIQVDRRYAAGPLRYGMYCRIVPQETYRPGDIVAYRSNIPYRRFKAPLIDRILAAGPAELTVSDGVLKVDGTPSPFRPILPTELAAKFDRRLQAGEFCIIPGGLRIRFADQRYFADMVIRSKKDILGQVEIRFPRWERTGGFL